jgi:CHAD domain-containing protein
MAIAGTLLESFDKRWEKYRAEFKRAREEFSLEAVHDLRVASRRMLALVELLRRLAPGPRLQKLRREFKVQLDGFDELRDTQVMLSEISERLNELPALRPFQEHLARRERKLLKAARKFIDNQDAPSTARCVKKARAQFAAAQDQPPADPLLIVDEVFAAAWQRFQSIDPGSAATIHRVRVAFKKFRYMVELVGPLTPGLPEQLSDEMHTYQTLMGEIQDAEVFLHSLDDFAEDHPELDLLTVREFYQRRHAETLDSYIKQKNWLGSAWRQTPGHSFPWENEK